MKLYKKYKEEKESEQQKQNEQLYFNENTVAMLVFILIICLGKTYRPMAALHKTYIRIDGILHEQKKFFDYEAVNRFLVSHGAAAHFGKWIDPVKYMGIRICIGAAGFVIGAQYHPAMGLVGCVIGFFVPKILLIQMNSNLPVEQLNTSSGDMLSFFFADGVMSIHEDRMSTAKH